MQISKNKLKQLRKDKSWSQEVLAKATGLSLRTIQRIENEGNASAESTLALASAFEVTPGDLTSAQSDIKVNYTRRRVMQGALVLVAIFSALVSLFNLTSEVDHYLDGPTVLFTLSITYLLTALSFGLDGLLRAITGLKYLFATDILGGNAAKYLTKIYSSQIIFCYAGALIISLIGTIAIIHSTVLSPLDAQLLLPSLQLSVPVVVLPFLYAVIFCECLIRPLKTKIESGDMKS
ncbi:helix-turn-helix domain-containing protein [Shewanella sp. UCD-KL12]|uniref:helix-turn-helix domain-containing protein n=1 Tax=Shewanella sp. UCD-KL12 TaxID=1917163 RepID=UPI0009710481|nr:helix-turn-helix transcriptional regulator [Shewanella sp. UCD-KL12]